MSAVVGLLERGDSRGGRAALGEGPLARRLLIGLALGFMGLFLIVPLAVVFISAFSEGIEVYWRALVDEETLSAIRLTLLAAGVSVPLNLVFGVAAAWVLSKYDFWGKSALVTLIDLPFSVSPVIAGLVFVLLFGSRGWFAPLLDAADVRIIFAVPGIVIATTFVTFPLVAREVLAVMQAQGSDEEEAALTLGASGWQILWRIDQTTPTIRPGSSAPGP
jgi:sulfate/thiosulfate transport system permease protein